MWGAPWGWHLFVARLSPCASPLLVFLFLLLCPLITPTSSAPAAISPLRRTMGSYVSTVAPASTASPVQPTLIVIGSGLAGLTSALRFLQVRDDRFCSSTLAQQQSLTFFSIFFGTAMAPRVGVVVVHHN